MSKAKDIKKAVNTLFLTAGIVANITQVDIRNQASVIAKKHQASAYEIEAEIARHLRNKG